MRSLPAAPAVRGARVVAYGDHRPATVVTNDDLSRVMDTNDAWIRERTGIVTRRHAGPEETVASMAVAASAKALANAGIAAADVDLVLLASCSLTRPVPGSAALVATELGAARAGAVDLNAACAGFCYGLSWAADAIRSGSASTVLVVGSERLTTWLDPADRNTSIIFGDGAGAAVVTAAEDNGIGTVVWGSDGAKADAIRIDDEWIVMDGQGVFRWATTAMASVARAALDAAGIEPSEVAAFVPHQANLRIVDSLARQLGIAPGRVARDIVDMGNTSGASIPLAICRLLDEGRVSPGDPMLLVAFGAGLTYAAQVVLA